MPYQQNAVANKFMYQLKLLFYIMVYLFYMKGGCLGTHRICQYEGGRTWGGISEEKDQVTSKYPGGKVGDFIFPHLNFRQY